MHLCTDGVSRSALVQETARARDGLRRSGVLAWRNDLADHSEAAASPSRVQVDDEDYWVHPPRCARFCYSCTSPAFSLGILG